MLVSAGECVSKGICVRVTRALLLGSSAGAAAVMPRREAIIIIVVGIFIFETGEAGLSEGCAEREGLVNSRKFL